ncbi:MAG: hypothetical protein HQK87_03260 [Nitrospinae bacterium]|nr:hypothetical protein [Nitrospinota bacterium]
MKRWFLSLLVALAVAPPAFAQETPPAEPAAPVVAAEERPTFHVLFLPGVRTMDSNKWKISVSDGTGDASRQTVLGGEFDFALPHWPAALLVGGDWSRSSKDDWGRSSTDSGSVEGTVWEGYVGARKYFGKKNITPYANGAVAVVNSRLTGKGYTTSEKTEVGVMGGGGLLLNLGPFCMGIDGRALLAADVGSYAQFTGVVGFSF